MSDSELPPCKLSKRNEHPSSVASGGTVDKTSISDPDVKRPYLEDDIFKLKAEIYDLRKALAEKDVIIAKLKSNHTRWRDRFITEKLEVFNESSISLHSLPPPGFYHYLEKDANGKFSLKRRKNPDLQDKVKDKL